MELHLQRILCLEALISARYIDPKQKVSNEKNFQANPLSLQAREQADGRICVVKESKVDSLERDQVCNKGARHNSLFAFCFQKMSSKPLYVTLRHQ